MYTGNIYQISGLKTIKLPSKLKYIKAGFLKGSTDLEKISIPNQVRTIGKEAFAGCRNLKIYIPATVKIWKKCIWKRLRMREKNLLCEKFSGI